MIIIKPQNIISVRNCMCFLKKNSEILYLSENLHKFGADIGCVMYLPTLDPNSPTQELINWFGLLTQENVNLLNQQMDGFKDFYDRYKSCLTHEIEELAFEFILDLHSSSDAAFLVEIKLSRNIEHVYYDRQDEVSGFDGDWKSVKSIWIFAECMEGAMQQGILLGKENLVHCNQKQSISVGES